MGRLSACLQALHGLARGVLGNRFSIPLTGEGVTSGHCDCRYRAAAGQLLT